MDFRFTEHPHRRLNILNGQWVFVSPHRTQRPWQGKKETETANQRPQYDPNCYLCPGNTRAGGSQNPVYTSTYVFKNDYAALLEDTPVCNDGRHPLAQVKNANGTCRVICFSPRHDLTLPRMSNEEIGSVIDVWADQINDLGRTYRWVQIFENKGDIMGCSNPHPHGQIWASDFLPNEPALENFHQEQYRKSNNSNMLLDYVEFEVRQNERIVLENEHWMVVVPFWAVWPYEAMLVPLRHVLRINDLSPVERKSLADILKRFLTKYDNLFYTSFPYSFGWHGAPCDNQDYSHWQLHAHFYPPLLRSSTIKKFMVGFELLAEAQRDITAEQAAETLRKLSETHYTVSSKES
jgi:UDPglucose--hexose-1-phosphate uridylyltransferase